MTIIRCWERPDYWGHFCQRIWALLFAMEYTLYQYKQLTSSLQTHHVNGYVMSVTMSVMSVIIDTIKKTGIMPRPYLILMYVKKFLQSISEESQQTDGHTRPIPRKNKCSVNGEFSPTLVVATPTDLVLWDSSMSMNWHSKYTNILVAVRWCSLRLGSIIPDSRISTSMLAWAATAVQHTIVRYTQLSTILFWR